MLISRKVYSFWKSSSTGVTPARIKRIRWCMPALGRILRLQSTWKITSKFFTSCAFYSAILFFSHIDYPALSNVESCFISRLHCSVCGYWKTFQIHTVYDSCRLLPHMVLNCPTRCGLAARMLWKRCWEQKERSLYLRCSSMRRISQLKGLSRCHAKQVVRAIRQWVFDFEWSDALSAWCSHHGHR